MKGAIGGKVRILTKITMYMRSSIPKLYFKYNFFLHIVFWTIYIDIKTKYDPWYNHFVFNYDHKF
jgi:hypothetical protein